MAFHNKLWHKFNSNQTYTHKRNSKKLKLEADPNKATSNYFHILFRPKNKVSTTWKSKYANFLTRFHEAIM